MINQKMYWKFRQEHNLPHDEAQRLASLPKFAGGGKVKAVKAAVKAISHPPELMAHFKRGKKLQNDPSEWARDELAENFEPDSAVLRKKYGEKAYMAAQDASYPEGYAGGGKVVPIRALVDKKPTGKPAALLNFTSKPIAGNYHYDSHLFDHGHRLLLSSDLGEQHKLEVLDHLTNNVMGIKGKATKKDLQNYIRSVMTGEW